VNIIVLRHGPVDLQPPAGNVNQQQFGDWITAYNTAAIEEATPPAELQSAVKQTRFVVCSDLARSLQSAALINRKPDLISPLYRECEMPHYASGRLKLPVNVWIPSMRLLQLIGIHPNAESFSEFRTRAQQSAAELNALAGIHRSVVVCGHGLLNHYLHKSLRKLGWSGTNRASSKHWGYRVYTRKTPAS
jgi:broad specificity phosphatase PhoE